MKLIAQVKLLPTTEQAQLFRQTLKQANALCNTMSEYAWDNQVFEAFMLQKLSYRQMRDLSGLSAQMVIRCYSKVADAYKLDKRTKRQFRKHGAIAYDDRLLHWYIEKQLVSIWSIGGRLKVAYQAGERQRELLQYRKGESDLLYHKHKQAFYLLAVCEIRSHPCRNQKGFLVLTWGS